MTRRALCLALLLATTGCDLLDRSAPPAEPVVLESAWSRGDVVPVSRPASAGGRVVLYSVAGGQLVLTAVDAGSGETVWSVPTSPSATTPGVELSVQVVGDVVVHLRPGPGRTGVLTAVDAQTGRQRWTDKAARVYSHQPGGCDDDAASVCSEATATAGEVADLRWRLADGRLTETAAGREESGREIGTDLWDTGDRSPEVLERREDGRVLWSAPVDRLFGAPVTSDRGWDLDVVDDVVVGGLGRRRPDVPEGRPASLALDAFTVTAGFEHDTGTPLWSDPGAVYHCFSAFEAVVESDDLPVRCRYTGTAVSDAQGTTTLRPGATATVEGFDPRTGRTTWSFDATGLPVLPFDDSGSVLSLGGDRVVLSDDGGRHVVLDLTDGTSSDAAPDTVGWCTQDGVPVFLRLEDDYAAQRDTTSDHAVPCRADGTPVDVPTSLDDQHGAVAGDVVAWADGARLRAARQVSGPRPSPSPSPSRAATT